MIVSWRKEIETMHSVRILIVTVLLCGLWTAIAAEDCGGALRACKMANNCGKKPDSKECKACQGAYDSCYARNQKAKKPAQPGPSGKKAA
jgi:hypothetical protein